MPKELLIGCGSNHTRKLAWGGRANWSDLTTLDYNDDHSPDVVWDLNKMPLPFEDGTFDEIHAYCVLEHLGTQGDWRFFFSQFAEFWRLLKHDGVLCGICPHPSSPWAWGDPSHTRVIPPESFVFLDQTEYTKQVGMTPMSDFRFFYKADFRIAHCSVGDGTQTQFVLRAVKPSRITVPTKREV